MNNHGLGIGEMVRDELTVSGCPDIQDPELTGDSAYLTDQEIEEQEAEEEALQWLEQHGVKTDEDTP